MLAKDEVPEPTVVLTLDDGYAENFSGLRAVAELERAVPMTAVHPARGPPKRAGP